ncbi:Tachykinin [Operophtera brumata]|uniref:Tachykinin n=1 Tax=Operophtera brumata TaxID=104452 RepID=A0A0L7KWR7_OPEBR|nr:Tachykinin [Operophtera brumata]
MSRLSKSIIAFVTIHLIAAVTSQELEKRGPQGFLGMRGKKLMEGEQFYKLKPQFFVGVKGKKNLYDTSDVFEPELYFKRAQMGFMGMRGKKDLFLDEEKRAPMGFVGMRGKKDLYLDEEKRAPMGFVGMRGKKDMFSNEASYPESFEYAPKQGSLFGQIDYASNNENANEFPLLNQIITEYLNKLDRPTAIEAVTDSNELSDGERFTNEIEKRAASIHQFFGVRGKKSLQNKRPYDVSFRGKFIGVRGKKDLKSSGAQEIKFLLDQSRPFPKRKGSMGFIGMRGKKWADGEILDLFIYFRAFQGLSTALPS